MSSTFGDRCRARQAPFAGVIPRCVALVTTACAVSTVSMPKASPAGRTERKRRRWPRRSRTASGQTGQPGCSRSARRRSRWPSSPTGTARGTSLRPIAPIRPSSRKATMAATSFVERHIGLGMAPKVHHRHRSRSSDARSANTPSRSSSGRWAPCRPPPALRRAPTFKTRTRSSG